MLRRVLDMRPVFFVTGVLLVVLSLAMLLPLVVDLGTAGGQWRAFAVSSALTLFFGVMLILVNRSEALSLTLRQTFVLTTLNYVVLGAFASLPLLFADGGLGPVDALFEALSGITTTGSTVISGLDDTDPGLLAWRAILQWLGGVGIIAIGIIILPFLRVGGMQIFRSESSDTYEKVVPRAADLVSSIITIYLSFTGLCILAYAAAGMPALEALCNGMTTVATGGYATRDASIGGFDNEAIEWIAIAGMMGGALPFVRYISFLKGEFRAIIDDSQVRAFFGTLLGIVALVTLWRIADDQGDTATLFRITLFNVTAIMTTTGYAAEDYTAWGSFAVMTFFLLSFLGGCTGSTTGGIKMFRLEILILVLKAQLMRLYSPNRVIPLQYDGKRVDADVMLSVMSFLFVFIALILVFSMILGAFGLDFVTAVSGATSSVANVGPGLGPVIGPAGNFAPLPDAAKLVLCLAMILGRLEFFTVLVLINPAFWRD